MPKIVKKWFSRKKICFLNINSIFLREFIIFAPENNFLQEKYTWLKYSFSLKKCYNYSKIIFYGKSPIFLYSLQILWKIHHFCTRKTDFGLKNRYFLQESRNCKKLIFYVKNNFSRYLLILFKNWFFLHKNIIFYKKKRYRLKTRFSCIKYCWNCRKMIF